ncbi:MAG: hypothetical protein ACK4K0_07335 [Flavobacteriales bacterium]
MRITFLIFFLLLSTVGNSQKHYEYIQGKDTLKLLTLESPLVCDCENFDYRNKEQQRICERLYDTGMMSADELKKYREEARICNNPTICDCANADMNNRGLIKSCYRRYSRGNKTEKQWDDLLKEFENCKTQKNYTLENLTICDCYNIGRFDYKRTELCQDKFWSDSSKTDIYTQEMIKCINQNKTTIDPSLCDCARFEKSDIVYKKVCEKKFQPSKLKGEELKKHLTDKQLCLHQDVLDNLYDKLDEKNIIYYNVCVCFNSKRELTQEQKEICMNAFDIEKLTINEIKAIQFFVGRCR